MVAVNGSALMMGCKTSGKRCEEKNTPDTIHIGIMIRFIRPEASSDRLRACSDQ